MVTVRVNDADERTVPVVDNLVSFSVAGPGKIIGIGNGDPPSHEPDKYIETVQSMPVLEWRTRAINARNSGPESAPGFDDSSWEKARDPRWDEHRVDPPAGVFRGQFMLPPGAENAAITLVLRSVGETQSIYNQYLFYPSPVRFGWPPLGLQGEGSCHAPPHPVSRRP